MKKNSLIIIPLLLLIVINTFFYNKASAKQNGILLKTDTVFIGNYILVIKVPPQSLKSITNYEEGVFVTYYNNKDSGLITIHYGAMVNKPLFVENNENLVITNKFIFENELYSYNGFCFSKDTAYPLKKYFREVDFIKNKITLMYSFVEESKIHQYNDILDNIIISRRRVR